MSRLHPVERADADERTAKILDAVKKKMGGVPNIVGAMANSPAVAEAYVGFSGTLATGTLSGTQREAIALAVAERNGCGYCLAAHTMLGAKAGLEENAIFDSRRGISEDPRLAAILSLASAIVEGRGVVSDKQVEQAREAGLTDAEVAEVVANVALNVFTNYFNNLAETAVDFPAAPALQAA